ncbi:MAG TPA: protease modulator HflC [Zoogloea sp.]|uniref:protease modulator HflC n=1 Tax=Zoogloea sp. TaxID=49181 RepID=UPI002B9AF2DB|nr:protease modulator HflC [Zoogloea sp.]HMV16485.1 protease modulator HflC [Rhodocyclaceae bacterium]HMV62058.1 protease modulator HflC [Rhodocyclaceae bacterium]HMW51260.1 protease modulator HflC [Rhodocyclaceae bacterium]HMY48869.1 protease modulator HflC [Rhodocyclaceae bacterium]HMZ75053.1 protease modulator HflC [Rhodocyclaceae bacterium]
MRDRAPFFIGVLLFVVALMSMSLFSVDQRQYALVFQLGEVKGQLTEPGLHVKIPLIQNVRYFDRRILTMDSNEPERFITSEKKNVLVDLFVKWRIVDPKLYYISVGGDESRAKTRLEQTVNAGLREEFGKRTVHEVVSGEREKIMDEMRVKADQDARKIGVQIVDVRLKRVDLPLEVSESVYRRMEAERKRVANELRSQGAADAEKIRADADKQREVIVAEAYREAQKVKGEGDAKASAIYAQAFSQNPEFFAFYRSLDAYRNSFKSKSDVLVLEPNADFFKYMKSAGGRGTATAPADANKGGKSAK